MVDTELENFGDGREQCTCPYCGRATNSRDHAPSKVFLDRPYPMYPPFAFACRECNAGFSMDEEYLACLIECCKAGAVDPSRLEREKIKRALARKPSLAERIRHSMTEKEGMVFFEPELERVRTVVSKLTKAHVAYENNTYCMPEPRHIMFRPLITMSETERRNFEDPFQAVPSLWPEVGSRAMQRLVESSPIEHQYQWIIVQEGRYRYLFYMNGNSPAVHLVIGEYLAAEAHW